MTDTRPPANVQAEKHVLFACFDPRGMEEFADQLTPEDFYYSAHRVIFQAMLDLSARNAPIDLITLSDELRNRGLLDTVGGTGYLAEIDASGIGLTASRWHGQIVRATALRRSQMEFAATVQDTAADMDRDVFEAQDWLEGELLRLGEERGYQPEALPDAVDESDRLLREGETGMPFHVRSLNRYVSMNPGLYTAVGGTRSTGKTRFALGEILDKCAKGIPVLMFSLEMTRTQLLWSLYAIEIGIPLDDLRKGVRCGARWFRDGSYARVLKTVRGWPLEIDDRGGLTVRQIAARARRFRRAHGGRGLIIIDFAQRIRATGKDERERYAGAAADLADMAKQLNLPVLLLMQVTEPNAGKTDKDGKPKNNALGVPDAHARGSLEYEILAETVIILNRPSKKSPPDSLTAIEWNGKAQAWISKNRFGTSEGVVVIGWREGVGHFCDLAEDAPMEAAPAVINYGTDEEPDFGDPFKDADEGDER